ncbi:leucine-rich repeat domain-containing protein [Paraburkholderia terrae]|uniref:leucine-rich repeat domain-containing protein n=1 Tax=Paraburkholderia terrae TaxID=311230 RepID=UPI00200A4B00|nr:leucine-rich repeat domain-containing protein [Paraburkholderia terrae]
MPHDAFISYSRKDRVFAVRLQKALEDYRPPKELPVQQRHLDVFRDEDDFTGAEYYQSLDGHLTDAAKLIVLCSPAARASRFVGDEIQRFARAKGSQHIIALLVAGLPNNEAAPGQEDRMAFPDELCKLMLMPLAADYRQFDARKSRVDRGIHEASWYTTLANLYGVSRAEIEQRESKRRARRRRVSIALSTILIVVLVGLLVAVGTQQLEKQETQALVDLGFSREPCDTVSSEPGCLAWAGFVSDRQLSAAVPHLLRLGKTINLGIHGTQIKNIESLKGLTGLRSLNLSNTAVAKIDALKGLTGLRSLNLSNTAVLNIDPLKSLNGLQQLYLSNTLVNTRYANANIDALKSLTDLRTLDLSNTRVTNIDALKLLTGLKTLNLSRTDVANIDALKSLTGLQTLDLSSTNVGNIDALKSLTGLQTLNLSSNDLENIDALKSLTGLQTLNLSNTQPFSNVDLLKGITDLKTLDLSGTAVTNVDSLKGITGLRRLVLSGSSVKNADAVKAAFPNTDVRF